MAQAVDAVSDVEGESRDETAEAEALAAQVLGALPPEVRAALAEIIRDEPRILARPGGT